MSQSKPNAETPGLPGLSTINDIVSTYFSIWERNVQVLNEIFVDCTRPEATVSDLPKAWNKLLHTWTHNVQDLSDTFMNFGGIFRDEGAPVVTFVIDQTSETSAYSQMIRVPEGVNPKKLVATPPVLLTHYGDPAVAPSVVLLSPVKGSIEIHLLIPNPRPVGIYLSVVCEPKAGAPAGNPLTNSTDPPPRTVIANVLVVFIDGEPINAR
jgi:hypothetical protein